MIQEEEFCINREGSGGILSWCKKGVYCNIDRYRRKCTDYEKKREEEGKWFTE